MAVVVCVCGLLSSAGRTRTHLVPDSATRIPLSFVKAPLFISPTPHLSHLASSLGYSTSHRLPQTLSNVTALSDPGIPFVIQRHSSAHSFERHGLEIPSLTYLSLSTTLNLTPCALSSAFDEEKTMLSIIPASVLSLLLAWCLVPLVHANCKLSPLSTRDRLLKPD